MRIDPHEWWQYLTGLRQRYVRVFTGQDADEILRDLTRFCRGHESTFHADPRMHAVLEGRREVLLRILSMIRLDDREFYKRHAGGVSFDPRNKEATE